MGWRRSASIGRWVFILTVAPFPGFFGFLPITSEPTEREQWVGYLDCPETLTVRWNGDLSRPPYVKRKPNSTDVIDGLFPGNVSANFPAFRLNE